MNLHLVTCSVICLYLQYLLDFAFTGYRQETAQTYYISYYINSHVGYKKMILLQTNLAYGLGLPIGLLPIHYRSVFSGFALDDRCEETLSCRTFSATIIENHSIRFRVMNTFHRATISSALSENLTGRRSTTFNWADNETCTNSPSNRRISRSRNSNPPNSSFLDLPAESFQELPRYTESSSSCKARRCGYSARRISTILAAFSGDPSFLILLKYLAAVL